MPVEMIPGDCGPPARQKDDALTRQVREGVHPADWRGRLAVAGQKLTGELPPGVDARKKSWRKGIAGGWVLLGVLHYLILGGILLGLGLLGLFAWFTRPSEWRDLIVPTILTLVGLGALGLAWRAVRQLKSISKA